MSKLKFSQKIWNSISIGGGSGYAFGCCIDCCTSLLHFH